MFGVEGLGFQDLGLGFRVFRVTVLRLGFRVRVFGLGFRVCVLRLRFRV